MVSQLAEASMLSVELTCLILVSSLDDLPTACLPGMVSPANAEKLDHSDVRASFVESM